MKIIPSCSDLSQLSQLSTFSKIQVSMTLQIILVIAGVFDRNFLHDIVYLGKFTLAADLRVVFLFRYNVMP